MALLNLLRQIDQNRCSFIMCTAAFTQQHTFHKTNTSKVTTTITMATLGKRLKLTEDGPDVVTSNSDEAVIANLKKDIEILHEKLAKREMQFYRTKEELTEANENLDEARKKLEEKEEMLVEKEEELDTTKEHVDTVRAELFRVQTESQQLEASVEGLSCENERKVEEVSLLAAQLQTLNSSFDMLQRQQERSHEVTINHLATARDNIRLTSQHQCSLSQLRSMEIQRERNEDQIEELTRNIKTHQEMLRSSEFQVSSLIKQRDDANLNACKAREMNMPPHCAVCHHPDTVSNFVNHCGHILACNTCYDAMVSGEEMSFSQCPYCKKEVRSKEDGAPDLFRVYVSGYDRFSTVPSLGSVAVDEDAVNV